jgi:hypothetical protein
MATIVPSQNTSLSCNSGHRVVLWEITRLRLRRNVSVLDLFKSEQDLDLFKSEQDTSII